jgi:hypothetical protein
LAAQGPGGGDRGLANAARAGLVRRTPTRIAFGDPSRTPGITSTNRRQDGHELNRGLTKKIAPKLTTRRQVLPKINYVVMNGSSPYILTISPIFIY